MSLAHRWRPFLNKLATVLVWRIPQYLYVCALEATCGRPPLPPAEGLTCELINRENAEWVRGWLGAGEVRRFQRLLNRGDVGIYVLADGEVVHYGWAALKLPGHTLAHAHDPIAAGDALLHRGFTREEQRRRGAGTYGVMHLLEVLRERYRPHGLRRVCVLVRTANPAPQHIFAGLGFQKKEQLTMLRLLGTCFIYRIRALAPDGVTAVDLPGRVRVRFKAPEVLWDPRLPLLRTRFE